MRRLALLNQKGGVGKTTTAANLGAALGLAGKRVLLVDLDPQAHLSLHYGVEIEDAQPSSYDLLTASTPLRDIGMAVRDGITLIPADIDLAAAEVELISVTGREVILREALEAVEADYDVLLIDCPPSLGVLTVNALAAAGEVLIPLQAHFLALQGVGKLLDTVRLVRQRINPSLTVAGFVLCMHESATRLAAEVVDDLSNFVDSARDTDVPWSNAMVYRTRIRRNIKLAESASFGQTVLDYAPRCNGARDYARLASEIFGVADVSVLPEDPAVQAADEGDSPRSRGSVGGVPPTDAASEKADPTTAQGQDKPAQHVPTHPTSASPATPAEAPMPSPKVDSPSAPAQGQSPVSRTA